MPSIPIRFIVHYFNATGRPQEAYDRARQGLSRFVEQWRGADRPACLHRQFDVPHRWQHHIPALSLSQPGGRRPAGGDRPVGGPIEGQGRGTGRGECRGLFAEPVQGSAGVIVPPKGWLKAIRETCRELDILFVADEVITGFGRTGPMFACESEGVTPDLMTSPRG
jgi:adenosylmethionine-8-amino-7-oxononanoate aminotransferase